MSVKDIKSEIEALPLHVAIVGDFALMYWIDYADRHVKILDIHAADR